MNYEEDSKNFKSLMKEYSISNYKVSDVLPENPANCDLLFIDFGGLDIPGSSICQIVSEEINSIVKEYPEIQVKILTWNAEYANLEAAYYFLEKADNLKFIKNDRDFIIEEIKKAGYTTKWINPARKLIPPGRGVIR